jgi:hypothetical protein
LIENQTINYVILFIMKKQRLVLFTILSTMLILFLGSCSKDDDNDDQNQNQQKAPQMEVNVVEVPQAMLESTDPGAQQAVMFINMSNAFVGWSSMMIPPQKSGAYKSLKDGPWVYTWDFSEGANNYTITLTINETSTQLEWTMVINGTIDGMTLVDFLYMEATELLDGSAGSFIMYDPEEQGIGIMVSWSINSTDVYTCAFEIPNDIKIETTSNPDGSGSILVYEFYETEYFLSFQAEWTAAGTGQWWEYYMGELVDQGVWP